MADVGDHLADQVVELWIGRVDAIDILERAFDLSVFGDLVIGDLVIIRK
jgi:hypothetical protein